MEIPSDGWAGPTNAQDDVQSVPQAHTNAHDVNDSGINVSSNSTTRTETEVLSTAGGGTEVIHHHYHHHEHHNHHHRECHHYHPRTPARAPATPSPRRGRRQSPETVPNPPSYEEATRHRVHESLRPCVNYRRLPFGAARPYEFPRRDSDRPRRHRPQTLPFPDSDRSSWRPQDPTRRRAVSSPPQSPRYQRDLESPVRRPTSVSWAVHITPPQQHSTPQRHLTPSQPPIVVNRLTYLDDTYEIGVSPDRYPWAEEETQPQGPPRAAEPAEPATPDPPASPASSTSSSIPPLEPLSPEEEASTDSDLGSLPENPAASDLPEDRSTLEQGITIARSTTRTLLLLAVLRLRRDTHLTADDAWNRLTSRVIREQICDNCQQLATIWLFAFREPPQMHFRSLFLGDINIIYGMLGMGQNDVHNIVRPELD